MCMGEIPSAFESDFNKKYGLKSRRIIRMLSENSRATFSDMAKALGISRQAVKKRIVKLYQEFSISNILELNEDELGLINPHVILIKFKHRPDDSTLIELFKKSYIPQLVIATKGSYDLIVYANAVSRSEYVHWDMGMHMSLSKYGISWFSSEVTHKQLGFFPIRNEALDRTDLPVRYKEIIKLLNSDSSASFKDLSRKLGFHLNSVIYAFKNLSNTQYIRRFTIAMRPPKDIILMSFVCKYTPGEDHELNSARARKAFMSDDKDSLISRYILCSQLIGSYDFLAIGAFDSLKVARATGVGYHRQCHKKSGIRMRFASVEKVLIGNMPINSLDTSKEYKTIKWEYD